MLDTIAVRSGHCRYGGYGIIASDMNPWLKWTLALNQAAGVPHWFRIEHAGARAFNRIDRGLGNIFVAIGEAVLAVILSLMAVVMPVVAAGVVLALVVVAVRKRKKSFRSPPSS